MSEHRHADHAHHVSGNHAPDHDPTEEAGLAELLDLDAEVLHSYWTDALNWVRESATLTSHPRILDLGAGTGTGAIALARLVDGAEVLAVDASEHMLGRIRAKATELGLGPRIRTVHADLDEGWPAVGLLDIVWASLSLHHLADPDRVLRDALLATRPGGLMAVAEFSGPLHFLPDDLGIGKPGLEARCLDQLAEHHAQALPELGSDWAARLEAAGFTAIRQRTFDIELTAPHGDSAVRYAELWLRRLRSGLAEQLAPDDRATFEALLDADGPESLRHRGDLRIRGSRTVTLGQYP